MLAAIGVALGARSSSTRQVPADGAPAATRSSCPRGCSEQEVYEHLRALAERNVQRRAGALVPRRRDVRPLRARDRRHALRALRVPDALHALSARGLAGPPAGDVRVPDRDLRAHRRCRSPTPRSTRGRARSPRRPTWRSSTTAARGSSRAPACTRTRCRRCARYARGLRRGGHRGAGALRRRGRTDAARWRAAIDGETSRGDLRAAELLRCGRGRAGAQRGGQGGPRKALRW